MVRVVNKNNMKKLLLLLIIPFLSFGQQEIQLRANEKVIMEDLWSILKPVYGKGYYY